MSSSPFVLATALPHPERSHREKCQSQLRRTSEGMRANWAVTFIFVFKWVVFIFLLVEKHLNQFIINISQPFFCSLQVKSSTLLIQSLWEEVSRDHLIFSRDIIHSSPWHNPSPVRAQHAWICHWWSFIDVSFKNWEISATVMHSLTSCLLAKISNPAFLRSSWASIL